MDYNKKTWLKQWKFDYNKETPLQQKKIGSQQRYFDYNKIKDYTKNDYKNIVFY